MIPVGSTEQHGTQGALGTDFMVPSYLADHVEDVDNVIVAPTVPYGVCPYHLSFEGSINIGYEGLRSFAFVTSNVSNSKLKYWLDYGELLSAGEMKAAYGSFLSALLVIYEHDKLADKFANYYNVTWNRVSPVVFSMCNDYRSVYITGESDHGMGMKVQGNDCIISEYFYKYTKEIFDIYGNYHCSSFFY